MKTFLSTVVPPSIRSLLSLDPFVFSSELARGDGPAAAILIDSNYNSNVIFNRLIGCKKVKVSTVNTEISNTCM